ncbi:MAG: ATP synthase F1 subunit epsilon [Bacteroidales bacterium]|nr:ATP synthase F1 subunit epsilon [Bacteroidales bacterium]
MTLEIITPDQTLYTGKVSMVQMPGVDGLFAVLWNHAPMIAVLKKGRVKLRDDKDQLQYIEIKGGIVEVLNNKVLILSE